MLFVRLTLGALHWRRAASITVFLVALVGMAAAAVGPIYLGAVDTAVLRAHLTDAPSADLGVHVVQDTTPGFGGLDWHGATRQLSGRLAHDHLFHAPVFSQNAPIEWTKGLTYESDLAALEGLCAHVRVVAGRCIGATGDADAVVTERIARLLHVGVGARIDTVPGGNSAVLPIRVVGIVAPVDPQGRYWSPWPYLITATQVLGQTEPRTAAFFVSTALLDRHLAGVGQTVSANLALRTGKVGADNLDRLRSDIDAAQTAAAHESTRSVPANTSVPTVSTGLVAVVRDIQRETTLARALVLLPATQLVVLALALLYAVVAGTASTGEREVALARLRGRRTSSVLAQGLAESVLLVLLAAPTAAALAWGIVRLIAPGLLGPGVPVTFPVTAVAVLLAVTVASIVAVAVAARRILTASVGQLLRRGEQSASPRIGLLLFDAATVALGAASLLELVSTRTLATRTVDPLPAVAAVMLGAALAVLAVRLLPLPGRLLIRWTRNSSQLAGFLAVRQIVRRPSGTRVVVLLGIALSLASFAVVVASSAESNRDTRALGAAGAHTVYYVRADPGVRDLRSVVDRADPSGNSAAAAVVQLARTTPVLAVDSRRFAGVAAWTANNSPTPLATILRRLQAVPPSVDLSRHVIRFGVDLVSGPAAASTELSVTTTGADHLEQTVVLGPLRRGPNRFVRALDCAAPCRVTALRLHAEPRRGSRLAGGAAVAARLEASTASTSAGPWHAVPGFADAARWLHPIGTRVGSSGNALTIRSQFDSVSTAWPTVGSADTPTTLPAVVTGGAAGVYNATTVHDITAFGLDSAPLDLNGSLRAVSLPTLGRNGVMIDLGAALDAMRAPAGPQAQLLVYANASAPSDLASRLAAHGVTVTRTVHATTLARALGRTGPAYADGLLIVTAGLGAVLAIGAAALAGATVARRRAYEFAALRTAALSSRVLRRAVALEQGALFVLGLVVGLAGGLTVARLALPKIPVFADPHVGLPLDTGLPLAPAILLAVGVAVVLALLAAAVAAVAARQATAARLREATT